MFLFGWVCFGFVWLGLAEVGLVWLGFGDVWKKVHASTHAVLYWKLLHLFCGRKVCLGIAWLGLAWFGLARVRLA